MSRRPGLIPDLMPGLMPGLIRRFQVGPVRWARAFVRSIRDLFWTLVFLQLWGPSMLPATIALSRHSGAVIGHLPGRYSDGVGLRPDSATGSNRQAFQIPPRIYCQLPASMLYRRETVVRETTSVGILGIATPGFDSAIADPRPVDLGGPGESRGRPFARGR